MSPRKSAERLNKKANKATIIRRMANNERKFLHIPAANISLCARIRGTVGEEDIRRGIEAVSHIHPLLAAKVVYKSPEEAFFARGDPDSLQLRTVRRDSDTQWFEEVLLEHRVPFDPSTGPMIRFILLASDQVSDLVIFSQHAICDGTALVLLLRDILNHAYNPAGEIKEIPPPLITDFIPPEKGGFRQRFVKGYSMGIINKRWQKSPHFFDHQDFLAIHRAFWNKYAYHIILFELDADQTDILHSACREHGVTIGSAITMAFLAAWQDVLEERKREVRQGTADEAGEKGKENPGGGAADVTRSAGEPGENTENENEQGAPGTHCGEHTIVLPYDLRNRLERAVGDVFCLFVGSIQVKCTYDRRKPFWGNVQEFHAVTRQKIEAREFFGPALDIERFDPTLMDAFMSYTLLAGDVPEDDPRYEKLSSFAEDTGNIAHLLARRTLSLLPEIINTNMGRAQIPDNIGDLQIEELYVAPSANTTSLVLGGIGTAHSVTFTINILTEKGTEQEKVEEAKKIRDRALEYIGFSGKEQG